ncbi:MAG: MGH1-like glycoside hydrolase domain-containing protein, partial [Myxococcaceae bacterium]
MADQKRADPEQARLEETRTGRADWKQWGPYLSERQWGTVREDYSEDGNAWAYFTHDQARARAYRWGEDGIAGISDSKQRLCFALALWNGRDPILKERLFGLTNAEGNHGEDVKEYYFYLDSTPTHSSMKYLYKYPQRRFPYEDLVRTNSARGKDELEYELLDTDAFDQDRYFDVFVEYAKAGPEDLLIRIDVANRGPEAADLHVLPTLWFRNTWSWGVGGKPSLERVEHPGASVVATHHTVSLAEDALPDYHLYCEGKPALLFTENETNSQRLWGQPNPSPYVKDGIHEAVVHGRSQAVNPAGRGTKVAADVRLTVGPGETRSVRLRLTRAPPAQMPAPFADLDQVIEQRRSEADVFYEGITPPAVRADADRARVMRQALAG